MEEDKLESKNKIKDLQDLKVKNDFKAMILEGKKKGAFKNNNFN